MIWQFKTAFCTGDNPCEWWKVPITNIYNLIFDIKIAFVPLRISIVGNIKEGMMKMNKIIVVPCKMLLLTECYFTYWCEYGEKLFCFEADFCMK